MELTTLEAIQYCIDEGIEGAEKRLKSYERRGRIDNADVLEAIRKDLETIHVTVNFKTDEDNMVLRGKKRRFLLGEKRIERAKRIDGRVKNGGIREENRKILDEHIFHTITKLESKFWNSERDVVEITTTDLIKKCAIINPNLIEHKQILGIIQENIFGEQGVVYAHTITEYIRGRIRDTNRNTLTSALNALEKADRIVWSFRYFIFDETGCSEIDERSYLMMKNIQESIIDDYNYSNGASFTLNSLQKIRAKEQRFLRAEEREFLKYMKAKSSIILSKKNVIRILKPENTNVSEELIKQVYSDVLLKRVKEEYINSVTIRDSSFFMRYRNFVLVKIFESFGVELPEWCTEYFEQYTAGFGEVQFHIDLLTEAEKEAIKLKSVAFKQEEIEMQLPF